MAFHHLLPSNHWDAQQQWYLCRSFVTWLVSLRIVGRRISTDSGVWLRRWYDTPYTPGTIFRRFFWQVVLSDTDILFPVYYSSTKSALRKAAYFPNQTWRCSLCWKKACIGFNLLKLLILIRVHTEKYVFLCLHPVKLFLYLVILQPLTRSRGNSLSNELYLSSVLGYTRAYLYSPVWG